MTRYFHLTQSIVSEFSPTDLPSSLSARGWKGNRLKSVLCRKGKGKTFEPSSDLPNHLKSSLTEYLKLFPKPKLNFEFNFVKNQGKNILPFNQERHFEFLNYCYPEN